MVLDVARGVVRGPDAVLQVVGVLSDVPLAVVEQLNAVPVPHAPLEEPGVPKNFNFLPISGQNLFNFGQFSPVPVDHGELAVTVLEAVVELADVLVPVVVEGGAVTGLQTPSPASYVGTCLAEEGSNA